MRFGSYVPAFMAITALLLTPVGQAHHSDAVVDKTRTVAVQGTIKQFAWSAPHAQVVVVTVDDKGQPLEVGVSTFTPAAILLQGLSPKDFRRGDKVEVLYHPNRSGAPGGILVKLIGQDGKVLNGELSAPPGAPAAN